MAILDDENIAAAMAVGPSTPVQQPQLDLHIAAEHYTDGMRRGMNAGALQERDRIITLLRSEKARDWLWNNWKGDVEIYDLLEKLIRSPQVVKQPRPQEERVTVDIPAQKERLEKTYFEADHNG
jgi:hypothetical protein